VADFGFLSHNEYSAWIGGALFEVSDTPGRFQESIQLNFLQRLILLTWKTCPARAHDQLKAMLRTWRKWDIITSLQNYKAIQAALRRHFVFEPILNNILELIVALDMDALCIQLLSVTKSPENYRELIGLRGKQAQEVIELLQTVRFLPEPNALDYVSPTSAVGSPIARPYFSKPFLERSSSSFPEVRSISCYLRATGRSIPPRR
jgi:hypothetical protein